MDMGKIIKTLRERKGWTQEELAEKVGLQKSAINKYEKGHVENMKRKMILQLSEIFDVTPSFLIGGKEDTKNDNLTHQPYRYYETAISAGIPDHVAGISESDQIDVPDSIMGRHAGQRDIFITRINGESMNRIIPDSSLIAVKPTEVHQLKDGDVVVYSDDGDYSVKRFYRSDDQLIFKPDSTDSRFYDYATSTENENLVIHGKVVIYIVELN